MSTRREWMLALLLVWLTTILVQIPYALGYALARPEMVFTGILMNPEDAQSYFAKMQAGFDGAWLYSIPFTTEEHAPAFLGGFYLLLGHLARVLGLSLEMMWHCARIGCDAGLFLVTMIFVAHFLRDARTRWIASVLAIFGSGLGWVLFLLNQPYWLGTFPVDFKMPEAHLFFTALTFPHVALGTTLLMVSLLGLMRESWRGALIAGVANLTLAIVYPFLIYLIMVITGLKWLLDVIRARRMLWRSAWFAGLALLVPMPLLVYYAVTLATNPVMRAWDAQAVTLSPPLPHHLIAYGVMIVLALLALPRRSEFIWLWAWLIAVVVLVYAPLNPQRRFVQGAQIPLAILATLGLVEIILPRLARTRWFRWLAARPHYSIAGLERLLLILFLLMMSLSNLYVFASTLVTVAIEQPYPLFRPRAEADAVAWLRANTSRDQVVLGTYEVGNYVAARAGNRVVVGHWAETMNWQTKFDETENFFTATDDAWRRDVLTRYHVAYVWVNATAQFNSSPHDFLEPLYSNSQVSIFRVRQ